MGSRDPRRAGVVLLDVGKIKDIDLIAEHVINHLSGGKGKMARRHKPNMIAASFHYLVKNTPDEADPANPIEIGFTRSEFQKIITRISNPSPLDVNDVSVITRIKSGQELPFIDYEIVDEVVHFGVFEGAYYGQQYRNNKFGIIPADSLNLRFFNYLITLLRDGKILVGVTYSGQFGHYEGLRSCLMHLLKGGNNKISSHSIRSIKDEIGAGVPTELRLTYRSSSNRPERQGIFGKTGVLAIKNTDFGEGFPEEVNRFAERVRGDTSAKKKAIALLVNQGNLVSLDDDDVVGCSAIVRQDGRTATIYFLGENNFATKYFLKVDVNGDGVPSRIQVRDEMIRVMRQNIMPLLG